MLVTLSGMVTPVMLLFFSKAIRPMPVTGKPFIVAGMMTAVAAGSRVKIGFRLRVYSNGHERKKRRRKKHFLFHSKTP